MALLERVATLLRANLNELIDRAEQPETMLKQLVLDMQNQMVQVKTQVAIAITDQLLLRKKLDEHRERAAEWMRKAELAVAKGDEALARGPLEKSIAARRLAESFAQQVEDQTVQVENLRVALRGLENKLSETQAQVDVLTAQRRRTWLMDKATEAGLKLRDPSVNLAFDRVQNNIQLAEMVSRVKGEMLGEAGKDRLTALENEDEIERLLSELKSKKNS